MAITFTGTGDWTAAARWSGGAEPTETDDVVISGDATMSVNGISGTDVRFKSLTTTSGGILRVAPAANLVIAAYGEATFSTASSFLCDVSGSPYTTTIKLNAGGTAAAYTGMTFNHDMTRSNIVGASKMLWTRLDGAANSGLAGTTGFYVDDATGWLAGDTVIIGATGTYSATPNIDSRVIDAPIFDSGTTGRALIQWSSGGNLTYTHPDNMYVGNFTRNLKVMSGDTSAYNKYGRGLRYAISSTSGADGMFTLSGVEFRYVSSYYNLGAVDIYNSGASGRPRAFTSIDNLSFYGIYGREFQFGDCSPALDFPMNDFLSYRPGGGSAVNNSQAEFVKTTVPNTFIRPIDRICLLNHTETSNYGIFNLHRTTVTVTNSAFGHIGCFTPMSFPGGDYTFENCSWYGNERTLNYSSDFGFNAAVNCKFNTEFGNSGTYASDWRYLSEFAADNCTFWADPPHNQTYVQTYAMPSFNLTYTSFNNVATDHRKYQRAGTWLSTTTAVNGPLAWSGKVIDTNFTMLHEFEVVVPPTIANLIKLRTRADDAGVAITVSAVLAGVTLSSVSHGGAINTWLEHSLSFSHSESGPKIVTIRYEISSTVANKTGIIDGVFNFPFVPKTRWYGYVFDETNPIRTVQLATTEASESVAYAYTGFTITGGASQSDVALTSNNTFRKLFDHSQAWGIQNFDYAVPVTADGPDTFRALGDVTTTDYTLNGSGSLSMGANTLTANDSFSYTYTGGTFSQATTVPSFAGGTLNVGAAGVYTYTQAAAMILSMTPTAPGTYELGDSTFTGQVDLRNTAAHAITVELPTGTSYTTSSNTGGTITVSLPVITADISITGMSNTLGANNRLQIINTTAISAPDWQANHAYATGDVVLRTSGIGSENTAGLYFRATTGGTSHATTEPTWDTTVGNTTADNTVVWTTYAILYYDADPAATSLTDTYIDGEEFLAGETVEIRFAEEDPAVSFKIYRTSVVATADGFSALVNATADSVYATYALSGAAYDTTYSPNYVASYLVLDTNTNFTGASSFAYYCYLLTTSEGMYRFWGGLTALDPGNVRNNVDVLDLFFDETAGFVRQTDDVRIFKSDGTRPALDPTTGGAGIEINWKVPVNVVTTGGSAVLPQDVIDIADAVWAKTLP